LYILQPFGQTQESWKEALGRRMGGLVLSFMPSVGARRGTCFGPKSSLPNGHSLGYTEHLWTHLCPFSRTFLSKHSRVWITSRARRRPCRASHVYLASTAPSHLCRSFSRSTDVPFSGSLRQNSRYKDGTTKACAIVFLVVPYRALQCDRCLVITT
jgi:hypothetical protein